MKWSKEADEAVSKVPFFIRKKVKRKVEEYAQKGGADVVVLDHVQKCRQNYLTNMEDEVKGYEIETCFGPSGCPNRAIDDDIIGDIENIPELRVLRNFLKSKVNGQLKLHHEFRISVSDCPNACSRPQITDVGLIGASKPKFTQHACNACGACKTVCKEEAISYVQDGESMQLDSSACIACGACIKVCPTGALSEMTKGYRIMLGGKLGRHPQLAREFDGIFTKTEALAIIAQTLQFYMKYNENGERLAVLLNKHGMPEIHKK
jgi:anaerobic sulfite reductase subunit C